MAIKLTTNWQSVINKSVYAGGVTTTFYLDAKYSTQDIANNITKIYTRLRSVVNYTGAGGTDYEFTCSYCTTRKGSDVWWIDTETILESPETSITHNADGSKILTLAATMKIGYLKLNESMSVDVELPTIPRASTIAVSNGNIGSNVAINIDRASNSFTHTLTYKYGNLSGTIVEKTTGTNINWKLPTEFYAQTPNTSLVGTVYCTTYSGNTQIGETKQDTFTAYVDESTNQPTILGTSLIEVYDNISRTLTGNSLTIIKDYSELNVTITPELHANATLSEYRIVVGNQTKTTQFNNIFNDVATNVINAYIKDSRGFKLEGKYPYEFSGLNLLDYFKPKITSINIRRTEQTSTEVIADLSGTYWNKSFGSITNVGSIQYSWRYKLASSSSWNEWSSWATLAISGSGFNLASLSLGSGYATNTSYDFQIRVKDALSNLDSSQIVVSTSQNVTVSTPIIEVYEDAVNVNGSIMKNGIDIEMRTFAQMHCGNKQTFANTTLETVTAWGNDNISNGEFYCDPINNRIVIPKGSAEYVEIYGNVAGAGYCSGYLSLFDENDKLVKEVQFLHQHGGNKYEVNSIASMKIKINDTSKTHYLKLSLAGYNNTSFDLNAGFGNAQTFIGAKKIK